MYVLQALSAGLVSESNKMIEEEKGEEGEEEPDPTGGTATIVCVCVNH